MVASFLASIISDEKNYFKPKDKNLSSALKAVLKTYSASSLADGKAYLDYNIPENRLAYLFKYAAVHIQLVTKCFLEILENEMIRKKLIHKDEIKICCLGGGPGIDIIGICSAMAAYAELYGKISQSTILDICGGWRNSLKRIVLGMKNGDVSNIPKEFLKDDFKADLIQVNLLEPLPSNAVKIISEADIICMTKFVSAVIAFKGSSTALEAICEKIKVGAVVLFIDNFQLKLLNTIIEISAKLNLKRVFGPVHKKSKNNSKSSFESLFGNKTCSSSKVYAVGWSKVDEDSWDTESESEEYEKGVTANNTQNLKHSTNATKSIILSGKQKRKIRRRKHNRKAADQKLNNNPKKDPFYSQNSSADQTTINKICKGKNVATKMKQTEEDKSLHVSKNMKWNYLLHNIAYSGTAIAQDLEPVAKPMNMISEVSIRKCEAHKSTSDKCIQSSNVENLSSGMSQDALLLLQALSNLVGIMEKYVEHAEKNYIHSYHY